MRYVEFDRKRRPSTIRDYRREIEKRLIPAFGEDTPLSQITTAEIEAFREQMVEEDVLSARTINKRLQQLHTIFKRAQRVHDLPVNPVGRRRAAASAPLGRLRGAGAARGGAACRERGHRRRTPLIFTRRCFHRPAPRRAARPSLGRHRLDAAGRVRPALVHRRRRRADEVGQGAVGPARRPGGSRARRAEQAGALDLGRGPRLRQRRRRAHRGLGAAPPLLPRARGAPACRTSASTTSATLSGRSRCRRSR